MRTLRRRLGGESQLQEFLGRDAARRKALESDPVFVLETEKLQKDLEVAYSHNPRDIEPFFRQFRLPPYFNFQQARNVIEGLPPGLQDVLNRYIRYASRFGVYFVQRKDHFEWRPVPPLGWKFRVNQRDGQLIAMVGVPPDSPQADYFEASDLQVSPALQELINSKEAKFVWIEDASGSSVLNDLESFAYHDQGLTFILHNAERPYLYCLFGERATKELLDRAGTAVSAFQREHYGRGKGGRPKDLARRQKALNLLKEPGRKKEKAGRVMTTEKISSSQSYLSRVGKESR